MFTFRLLLAVRPAAAGAADLANSQLARTDSQRSAVVAAEAARLEAVLELAGKCNQAMQAEDWELM